MKTYPARETGYAMLTILLGVMLLTGIVYLIMNTMAKYHAHENARSLGTELAPIVSELLITDLTEFSYGTSYALVSTTQSSCHNATPVLSNISERYIQSLKTSGFDLASAACVTLSE